jgi:ubiquinol-cytochrome c reductase cytochrome b subunit
MQTPTSIVPEWYLLPFYAILRSIPNKTLGVVAMLSALLILLALPVLDRSRIRGMAYRPASKLLFWIFIANFLSLLVLGGKHVETPFTELGQICTFIYFAWFLLLIPVVSTLENVIADLAAYFHKDSLDAEPIRAPLHLNLYTLRPIPGLNGLGEVL